MELHAAFKKRREEVVDLSAYQRPEIVSYSDEDILDVLGPARTLYGSDPTSPGG